MNTFTDYYGKPIKLGDRVLFADKDTIREGEVTEIYGNCFHVKGDDGYKRSFGCFDKVTKLDKGGFPTKKNNRLSQLTTEDLLNIFWYFDSHGLIDPNLCFDPEHFMEAVAKEKLPSFDYHKYLKTNK